MTARELQDGHDWITRAFYSPVRLARRFARHAARPGGLATLKYLAAIILACYGRVRQWHIGTTPRVLPEKPPETTPRRAVRAA